MQVIPAIDILEGRCVRLYQGDYNQVTPYNESPLDQAYFFEDQGVKRIHIVDLDGAKKGSPVNQKIIQDICAKTKLMVELGGGLRSLETCFAYWEIGVKKLILGTALVKNPELLPKVLEKLGPLAVVAGIDFLNNKTALSGWLEETSLLPLDFALQLQKQGVEEFIFTDISKDGTLSGPNLEFYQESAQKLKGGVIASGGVSKEEDLKNLSLISGIHGVIVGKAYYEGKINLKNWV